MRLEEVDGKVFVVLHQVVHPVDILTVRGIGGGKAAAQGFDGQAADPAVVIGAIDCLGTVPICHSDLRIRQKLVLIKNLDILSFRIGHFKGNFRDIKFSGGQLVCMGADVGSGKVVDCPAILLPGRERRRAIFDFLHTATPF